uniref:Immunoglobulin I-set domain-containing protein n=1 Tax=Megaselia scalaris TaxID=36166 RepID=T1GFB7_MEGSC
MVKSKYGEVRTANYNVSQAAKLILLEPATLSLMDDVDILPESIEDINGTLTFRNVSSESKGSYTCVASNSQGEITAK